MPTGLLMRSTGSRYTVRGADGTLHECIAKGKLRIKGFSSTNPLAVGDVVDFEPAAETVGNELVGAITHLHDRRNYLVRKSVNLSHHKHVIASNMDQCLVLVTVARPFTSFGFIDRSEAMMTQSKVMGLKRISDMAHFQSTPSRNGCRSRNVENAGSRPRPQSGRPSTTSSSRSHSWAPAVEGRRTTFPTWAMVSAQLNAFLAGRHPAAMASASVQPYWRAVVTNVQPSPAGPSAAWVHWAMSFAKISHWNPV